MMHAFFFFCFFFGDRFSTASRPGGPLAQAFGADGSGGRPDCCACSVTARSGDFALLSSWLLGPQPLAAVRAALEGLAVGLSAGPCHCGCAPCCASWLRVLQPSLPPLRWICWPLAPARRALAALAPAALELRCNGAGTPPCGPCRPIPLSGGAAPPWWA